MPWTVSHAAAILPFRRWCPARLSFVALVAGSMSPDLGYYLGLFRIADFAHTAPGLAAVSLPAGLLMVVALHWLREPLAVLLPQPHRHMLERELALLADDLNRRRGLALAISVGLGAATHVAWDSFTHATGLPVASSVMLQRVLLRVGSWDIETYNFLQHSSTLFGIVVLVVAYRSCLKSGSAIATVPPDAQDAMRRWILGSIVALGAATCAAWIATGISRGESAIEALVVESVFVASNLSAIVYLAVALVWRYLCSGRGSGDGTG